MAFEAYTVVTLSIYYDCNYHAIIWYLYTRLCYALCMRCEMLLQKAHRYTFCIARSIITYAFSFWFMKLMLQHGMTLRKFMSNRSFIKPTTSSTHKALV